MNNFLFNRYIKRRLIVRIYLITGLLILLLQPVVSFAQKITLNYPNTPLEQVLREIRKQSGYDIFFDQTLVSQQPPVTVKIANANVEEAMATVLKGLPLSFVVNGKTISVKRPDKNTAHGSKQQTIMVSGTIIDENGLPKAGVSISSGTLKPVYTDGEGKFTLKDIEPMAMVRISFTGYATLERTALAISLLGQIALEPQSINLNPTIIQGQRTKALGATTKIDLAYRRNLNLSTVLEGTIPGLIIRSQKVASTVELYRSDGTEGVPPGYFTKEQLLIEGRKLLAEYGYSDSEISAIIEAMFLRGRVTGKVTSQTTVTNNIYPELRGAGGFGLGNNAMLVVIDGFVQDNFPSDYPMNNVLSLEVIRDPAETIKWGPRAANGVIVITTNGGKPGELQISYNSNFNFSAAPDNSASAMQRANTAQMLDFEKDLVSTIYGANGTGLRPNIDNDVLSQGVLLFEKHATGKITEDDFQRQLNMLSQLSNEAQYRQQQQGIFNQNQNLNLSGGGKHHRFSLNGNYNTSHSEVLGNRHREWAVNFRDQLSLLENKLQIALQVNAIQSKNVSHNALDPSKAQPYQMLYRPNGSYVYDYIKTVSENKNNELKQEYPGLQDYGYNPLEESRNSSNTDRGHNLNSSLNVNWKLLDGLNWSTNLQYISNKINTENLRSANTFYTRELYNDYYAVTSLVEQYFPGSGVFESTPLNPPRAYIPLGNIFQASQSRSNSSNLRTGLTYNKVLGQKHALNLGLGFSYFDRVGRSSSDMPIYGYNSSTGLGTALALPAPTELYGNVRNAISFNRLNVITPGSRAPERNMSTNAAFDYTYDGRLGLQAFYNESFMPINSADIYSSTRNYNALASWALHKESFFKFPLISKLKLSAGFGEIKMASLPVNLPATRAFQPDWRTTSLVVKGYNPVRQNGEQIRNYDALLDLGMFKDVLQAQLNYRYNSMGVKNQLSGRVSYHISKASYFNVPWVSNLMVEGLVSNISPAQALAQMMSTNSPLAGGGFSAATGNFDMGALPPHIKNKEISLRFGLWKDRLNVDVRHYNRSTSGMPNSTYQSDLSTGFSARAQYSRIDNKGFELYLQAKILQGDGFTWTSTVNAAYNINLAKDVVKPLYDLNALYLRADRSGYATGSLWSYRWAGLDAEGNPQVFDPNGNKVIAATVVKELNAPTFNPLVRYGNENWIEYSGRTTPPWSGAFIQEFGYKRFYARATLRFALGHVMRTYRPGLSAYAYDNSNLIAKRWRKPGDEAFTDIPVMDRFDATRAIAVQNSSNSIAPADFFRLTEIQFGYDVPVSWLKSRYLKSLNLAFNMQNVGLWTRNKLGIDPEAIMTDGKLLVRQPLRYGISLNVGL